MLLGGHISNILGNSVMTFLKPIFLEEFDLRKGRDEKKNQDIKMKIQTVEAKQWNIQWKCKMKLT